VLESSTVTEVFPLRIGSVGEAGFVLQLVVASMANPSNAVRSREVDNTDSVSKPLDFINPPAAEQVGVEDVPVIYEWKLTCCYCEAIPSYAYICKATY
jgi:hypothetical protein